ncbi:MAG: bifunctional protein FolD [Patescibacteria group bacterium]|nr:MAG: bifunctional protein FolD [Patescibacteria group bacterium]
MIIFDGNKLAQEREQRLKKKLERDFSRVKLVIAAILFQEDAGSRLYTRLKGEAAARLGIEYRVFDFSLSDEVEKIQTKLEELGKNPEITGIIIQKPSRNSWLRAQDEHFLKVVANQPDPRRFERDQYGSWWTKLTSYIDEQKDVDGLHPITIQQISDTTWQDMGKVLPATCQAVLNIFDEAFEQLSKELMLQETQKIFNGKYIIIGKSELLGIPLFYELKRQGRIVEIIASKELEDRMRSGQKLLDASVIVTATGRKGLITGEMVSENVVVIDVGEPQADVDFNSVSKKAIFITPVPGGVGPMTVISLLENCVKLASYI